MSIYTWAWIAWAVAFCVIEGVALANRNTAGTLSAHVWAFMGVRRPDRPYRTPKWTLRVARTVVLSGLLWLGLHLATGGWV